MNVVDDLSRLALRQEAVLTIGTFDGLHVGHQALIRQVVSRARATDRLAAVVTFHPHPAAVLAPARAPQMLTTPGEKLALLERLQVDLVAILRFDARLAEMPAYQFVAMLVQRMRLRELWVGPDFRLGYRREGTVPRLQAWGRDLGYDVHVIEPITAPAGNPIGQADHGPVISSSRIRALLREGHVARAAQMLGRYASVSGEVVRGAGRGHKLGFPTANLDVRAERAVPADGVYAVFARLGDVRYPAVANVGVRPSFDNGRRTIETHILDFDEDIYGCDLVVEFVSRLRGERRFEDISALVAQIQHDCRAARAVLEGAGRVSQGAGSGVQDTASGRTDGARPALTSACPYRYEEIEHTADRAIRVEAHRLADLFTGAARGMYGLMVGPGGPGLEPVCWRQIQLEAEDRETLMVEWLNELLYLTESEGLVFTAFEFRALSETSLLARVGGAPAPAAYTQVKAATFHNLALVEDRQGWSAEITFDV